MALGYGFVVGGLILIIKGWFRIYFAGEAGQELLTDDVYGLVRHPQYAGIFLAIFGQLVHWPTIPTLVLAPIIVFAFVRLAGREEARLNDKFGTDYLEYRRRALRLVPHPMCRCR